MNRSAVPRVFFGRTRDCSNLFAYGRAEAMLPGTLRSASFFPILVPQLDPLPGVAKFPETAIQVATRHPALVVPPSLGHYH